MDSVTLINMLDRRFSLDELHALAFDCGWADDIGTNHTVKKRYARSLVSFAKRRAALPKLMQMAARANPVLVFDGTVLRETGGEEFDSSQFEPEPEIEPVSSEKDDIIRGLQKHYNDPIGNALVYLLKRSS